VSRRSQVVRTDDQAGTSAPRTIGGCEILCSVAGLGAIPWEKVTTIASIDVHSNANYRRCFIRGIMANVTALVYEWMVQFGPLSSSGISPSESPHWIVTPDPGMDGNIPLLKVIWEGKAMVDGEFGEGGTVEFWIDDDRIYTFNSVPVTGEANDQQWVDLTGFNIDLVPGQAVYFKCLSGDWFGSGGRVGGAITMNATAYREESVIVDWS
jgi:hypothetical protein